MTATSAPVDGDFLDEHPAASTRTAAAAHSPTRASPPGEPLPAITTSRSAGSRRLAEQEQTLTRKDQITCCSSPHTSFGGGAGCATPCVCSGGGPDPPCRAAHRDPPRARHPRHLVQSHAGQRSPQCRRQRPRCCQGSGLPSTEAARSGSGSPITRPVAGRFIWSVRPIGRTFADEAL